MAEFGGKGNTYGEVLDVSSDSFRRFMRSRVEKLVPAMVKKNILEKKLGRIITKKNDCELLLANMKDKMTLDDFIIYLEVLIDLGSSEPADIKGGTRAFMRIMKGSLEAMKPEQGSKLDETITRFIAAAFPSSTQTAAGNPPPRGQIGDALASYFTSVGGVLYSPVHGVSVSIPPNAIPVHIKHYHLGMHFYLGGPFVLPDGVVSCSVFVWFCQSPYFEFLEDVTVKIPHAAKIDVANGGDDDSLCIFTWGEDKEGPIYKLLKEVPADFSDGYHAVFKVRHFCPKTVGKKGCDSKASKNVPRRSGSQSKSRKRTSCKGLDRINSDSLEKSLDDDCTTLVTPPASRSGSRDGNGITESQSSGCVTRQEAIDIDLPSTSCESEERDESESKISFVIARLMPADRSGLDWEVTFAACYDHPSAYRVREIKYPLLSLLYWLVCIQVYTSMYLQILCIVYCIMYYVVYHTGSLPIWPAEV